MKVFKYKTINNFVFIAFVFCLLLLSSFIVLNFNNTFANENSSSINENLKEDDYPFDREEIKIDKVLLNSDKTSVKAGENVNFNFTIEPYYAIETLDRIEYKVVRGKNYATIDNNGVLAVNEFAKAYEAIGVKVFVNDTPSNVVNITVQKTKVEDFSIISNKSTIREGGEARVEVEKLLPYNASFQNVKFVIIEGDEYASIDENTGLIQVKNNIENIDAQVSVCAYTCENYVFQSNILTFDIYVPVKNINLSASETFVKISSTQGRDVVLTATTEEIVTNFNPIFCVEEEYRQFVEIEGNVLHIKNNLPKEMRIPVWAEQDNAQSNIIYIDVYFLTEDFKFNANENIKNVTQFLSYDFSVKTIPAYALSQKIEYMLTSLNGQNISFAQIDKNGQLIVDGNAPVGEKMLLTIQNKDIKKQFILTIQEYQASSIELKTNRGTTLMPNDKVEFSALLDNRYTSSLHFSIEIVSGEVLAVDVKKNYITVKNLQELENLGKNSYTFVVRLKTNNDVLSQEEYFTINLPVESMKNQTLYVNRGETIYIDMIFNKNNFATNKKLIDLQNQVVAGQEVIVRNSSKDGQIEVILPKKLTYNTMIQILVTSKDGNKTCTLTLFIKEIDIDLVKGTLDEIDSAQEHIDSEKPELWVNRALKNNFTYNGNSILDYGLQMESENAVNAVVKTENDKLTITANDVKGGSTISYNVTIIDGEKEFNLSFSNLKVFNPASLSGAVYAYDENTKLSNKFLIKDNLIELKKYYKQNDNKDSPITKTWLTSNDGIYVSENTIKLNNQETDFDVTLHYSQTYNGKEIEVGQTEIIFVKSAIKRDYNKSGDNLVVHDYEKTKRNYQFIDMNFKVLKEMGYKSINLLIEIDIAEIHDGYKDVYVFLNNNSDLKNNGHKIYEKLGIEQGFWSINRNWVTHKLETNISIDMFINNPYLRLECGAGGGLGDDWNWGHTRITYTALA